jgi:hypothetical protein
VIEQGLEIVGECADPRLFGLVRVTVSAEVERDDVELLGDHWGDMVPPVRVGAAPVQQYHLLALRVAPVERVELHTFEG